MKKVLKTVHWLYLYTAVVLLIALLVNLVMYLPIPTLSTLTSGDWLSFWGSYLGGAIGCIPAIAAFRHTQVESARLHEETAEAKRCSVMPMFSINLDLVNIGATDRDIGACSTCIALYSDSSIFQITPFSPMQSLDFLLKHLHGFFPYICQFRNIGLGPVSDFSLILSTASSMHHAQALFNPCGVGENIRFALCLPQNTTSTLVLSFSDILGNKYSQSFKLVYRPSDDNERSDNYDRTTISVPTLVKPE